MMFVWAAMLILCLAWGIAQIGRAISTRRLLRWRDNLLAEQQRAFRQQVIDTLPRRPDHYEPERMAEQLGTEAEEFLRDK